MMAPAGVDIMMMAPAGVEVATRGSFSPFQDYETLTTRLTLSLVFRMQFGKQ